MKWYKKQLDTALKSTAPKQSKATKTISASAKKTALDNSPRQTKKDFARGVNSMFQRNKNRPKTDLY